MFISYDLYILNATYHSHINISSCITSYKCSIKTNILEFDISPDKTF